LLNNQGFATENTANEEKKSKKTEFRWKNSVRRKGRVFEVGEGGRPSRKEKESVFGNHPKKKGARRKTAPRVSRKNQNPP